MMTNDDDMGMVDNLTQLITGAVVLMLAYCVWRFLNSDFSKLFGSLFNKTADAGLWIASNPWAWPFVAILGVLAFLHVPEMWKDLKQRVATFREERARRRNGIAEAGGEGGEGIPVDDAKLKIDSNSVLVNDLAEKMQVIAGSQKAEVKFAIQNYDALIQLERSQGKITKDINFRKTVDAIKRSRQKIVNDDVLNTFNQISGKTDDYLDRVSEVVDKIHKFHTAVLLQIADANNNVTLSETFTTLSEHEESASKAREMLKCAFEVGKQESEKDTTIGKLIQKIKHDGKAITELNTDDFNEALQDVMQTKVRPQETIEQAKTEAGAASGAEKSKSHTEKTTQEDADVIAEPV